MVVLATKCYVEGDARDRALDGMNSLVANDIGELDVDWQVGVRDDDFVQVDVSGEDAEVARNVLAETWGEIVAHDDGLEAGEEYVGTLESWDDDGFVLDAGVDVQIPADEIGLAEGRPSRSSSDSDWSSTSPCGSSTAATSATRTPSRAGCRTPSATACTTGSAGTVVSTLTRRLAARSARP